MTQIPDIPGTRTHSHHRWCAGQSHIRLHPQHPNLRSSYWWWFRHPQGQPPFWMLLKPPRLKIGGISTYQLTNWWYERRISEPSTVWRQPLNDVFSWGQNHSRLQATFEVAGLISPQNMGLFLATQNLGPKKAQTNWPTQAPRMTCFSSKKRSYEFLMQNRESPAASLFVLGLRSKVGSVTIVDFLPRIHPPIFFQMRSNFLPPHFAPLTLSP